MKWSFVSLKYNLALKPYSKMQILPDKDKNFNI